MKNPDFEPAFTETEIKGIAKSCQHNLEQFCINQRVALGILGFGKEELCKRVATDPGTYDHLLHTLEECMESLQTQIDILKTAQAQARRRTGVGERMKQAEEIH
jgi:hypothetical protein